MELALLVPKQQMGLRNPRASVASSSPGSSRLPSQPTCHGPSQRGRAGRQAAGGDSAAGSLCAPPTLRSTDPQMVPGSYKTIVSEETDQNTIRVGELNTSLTSLDRLSKQKINKETSALTEH